MHSTTQSRFLIGMRVDGTSYRKASDHVIKMVSHDRGGYICISTVHMVMEGHDDPKFQRIVNSAEIVTPDGMPLVWSLRLLGVRNATRVYGPALTPIVCSKASNHGIPVGFYGGSPKVLEKLVDRVKFQFPDLDVAYAYSPPFRPLTKNEELEITQNIRASGVRILFVGLGCPKQERWMAEHRTSLPDVVMLGVGAAFDFIAGMKRQAPFWIQNSGLEWLFRLVNEPKRLWRRYTFHNPRFLYLLFKQLATVTAHPLRVGFFTDARPGRRTSRPIQPDALLPAAFKIKHMRIRSG